MARTYTQTARAEATEQTRKAILETAITQFRCGEFETNLEAIAQEACVATRTILRHFGSKEGLVEAAIAAGNGAVRRGPRAPAGGRGAFRPALGKPLRKGRRPHLADAGAEDRYPLVREA